MGRYITAGKQAMSIALERKILCSHRRPCFRILCLASVFREFHGLLPGSVTSITSDEFIEKFTAAGISKLAFLRHGNTAPASDGVDFNRKLTEDGRRQAKDAGQSFGRSLLPLYPIALVSPAPRTTETAEIFLLESNTSPVQLLPLKVAYDGAMQPEGSLLFKKLGYAPLLDYINNESDPVDKVTAQRVLGQYASDVTQSILDLIDSSDRDSSEQHQQGMTLLFVGHAIYLPAVAYGVASRIQCDGASKNILLKRKTGEAEGYLIDLKSRMVHYLEVGKD